MALGPETDPTSAGTPPTIPPSLPVETPVGPRDFNALAAQAQIQQQVEELKAKYSGLYGWAMQQKQAFDMNVAAKDATIADLGRQVANLSTQVLDLQKTVETSKTVQEQLTLKTTEAAALQSKLDKQKLLMKFPALLAIKTGEGEAALNPVLDLALTSDMSIEQLEQRLVALSATMLPITSAGFPPMPPQSNTQDDTPEGYRKQALEWHSKSIHAPTATEREEAKRKEAEYWDLAKKAKKT